MLHSIFVAATLSISFVNTLSELLEANQHRKKEKARNNGKINFSFNFVRCYFFFFFSFFCFHCKKSLPIERKKSLYIGPILSIVY